MLFKKHLREKGISAGAPNAGLAKLVAMMNSGEHLGPNLKKSEDTHKTQTPPEIKRWMEFNGSMDLNAGEMWLPMDF